MESLSIASRARTDPTAHTMTTPSLTANLGICQSEQRLFFASKNSGNSDRMKQSRSLVDWRSQGIITTDSPELRLRLPRVFHHN